jgi:hypothetical protein
MMYAEMSNQVLSENVQEFGVLVKNYLKPRAVSNSCLRIRRWEFLKDGKRVWLHLFFEEQAMAVS